MITEGYSPIEQYIGDGGLQEGPWTDLYALGATGYWLVSGRKPWNAVMRMAGDRLTPALALGQDLYPPTLLASLDRALAIQPQERYPNAAEWLAALEDPTARVSEVRRRPVRRSAPVLPPAAEPVTSPPAQATTPPASEPVTSPPASPPKSAPRSPPAPEPPAPPGPPAPTAGRGSWLWGFALSYAALRLHTFKTGGRGSWLWGFALSWLWGFALLMAAVGLVWVLMGMEENAHEPPPSPPRAAGTPAPPPAPRASPAPSPVASEPRWISGALVNVRSGPGAGHPVVTQLARGSEVTSLGASAEDSAWQRLRLNDGRVAYVYGNLLSRQRIAAAPVPAPRPAAPAARQPFEPDLVRIPGGCFQMGSPTSEADRRDNERQHRVCVEAFEIGKYEVTQGEWQAVMGNNPSHFKHGDRHPVESVSWNDVQDYLQRLNQRTGKTYRLPTEAEWEYACRGGVEGQRYCGSNDVDRVAWYRENSGGQTQPVGRKAVNGFGLYDMSGNVWEWTCSLYDKDYNGAEARCIGKGTSSPRSLRGGSWYNLPAVVRSASRGHTPTDRISYWGFRLARSF